MGTLAISALSALVRPRLQFEASITDLVPVGSWQTESIGNWTQAKAWSKDTLEISDAALGLCLATNEGILSLSWSDEPLVGTLINQLV